MFTIGEFSKIAGLSVKALRLYHNEGILVPRVVDRDTGYRYYDARNVEQARVVALLRGMLMPLDQIKEVMASCGDDADALVFLESHRAVLAGKVRELRQATAALDAVSAAERAAKDAAARAHVTIEEVTLPPLLVATQRVKGRYDQSGKVFAQLARKVGMQIAGKPLMLIHDDEYKEEDADFECCFPVRKLKPGCRELPGGRAVTLVHEGPYAALSRSYARVFAHLRERGITPARPTREVYLKGPGMLFKGNPARYLTRLEMLPA